MASSAQRKGEGGRAEAEEVDTGQKALEAIGRIRDLEAFSGLEKPGLPSSSRESNSAQQIVWADV